MLAEQYPGLLTSNPPSLIQQWKRSIWLFPMHHEKPSRGFISTTSSVTGYLFTIVYQFRYPSNLNIYGFTDASWAGDKNDRTTSFRMMLNKRCIAMTTTTLILLSKHNAPSISINLDTPINFPNEEVRRKEPNTSCPH
jgi:hypothetical protein